jgi:hypothetical protein
MNIVTVEFNLDEKGTQKYFDIVSVDHTDEKYLKLVRATSVVMIRHSFVLSVTVESY